MKEYLQSLNRHTNWFTPNKKAVQIGDIVYSEKKRFVAILKVRSWMSTEVEIAKLEVHQFSYQQESTRDL